MSTLRLYELSCLDFELMDKLKEGELGKTVNRKQKQSVSEPKEKEKTNQREEKTNKQTKNTQPKRKTMSQKRKKTNEKS